jgi:hypothetical protein
MSTSSVIRQLGDQAAERVHGDAGQIVHAEIAEQVCMIIISSRPDVMDLTACLDSP